MRTTSTTVRPRRSRWARTLTHLTLVLLLALGGSVAMPSTAHAGGWTRLVTGRLSDGILHNIDACKTVAAYGSSGIAYRVRARITVRSVSGATKARWVAVHFYHGTLGSPHYGTRRALSPGLAYVGETRYGFLPATTGRINLALYSTRTASSMGGTTPASFTVRNLATC